MKQVWEVQSRQSPISLTSTHRDEPLLSRNSNRRNSLLTRSKSTDCLSLVTNIDIKSAHHSRRSSGQYPKKGEPFSPTAKLDSGVLTPSRDCGKKSNSRVHFEKADWDHDSGVFLVNETPNSRCVRGKKSLQPTRSSYKLFRTTKKQETEVESEQLPSAADPTSLIKFVESTLGASAAQPTKPAQIKHLRVASDPVVSPKDAEYRALTEVAKLLAKDEPAESGKTYLIKNHQNLRFSDGEGKGAGKYMQGKSRAERLWVWKGKRGSINRLPTIFG